MGSELALMAARLDLHANARRISGWSREERRRYSLRAIQDGDREGLWGIVLAHLVLHGRRGMKISTGTLEKYKQAFDAFLDWTQGAGVILTRPHEDTGRLYIRGLESRGFRTSSVRWHLASVKALYAALRWCDATDADPFQDVRPVHDGVPQVAKGKIYSAPQIDAMLEVARPEERVIILLGADLGMRAAEIGNIQRTQIHLDADPPSVLIVGKGAKTRQIPLSRRAEDAVRTWLNMTPGFGPGLLHASSNAYLEGLMKSLCARAGVKYVGVHALRRQAGTRMYEATEDLLETRDFLGHRTALTTEVYVQYAKTRKKPINRDW